MTIFVATHLHLILSERELYTEQELLLQVSQGNEPAFNALFEQYRPRIHQYLLLLTKSTEVAEEIVIDIFVKLWIGRSLLSQVENAEAFLRKIAYNKAMDFFRTTARHTRLRQAYLSQLTPEPDKSADEILIDAEARQLIYEAVNQLPPQRKLIYTMSREQGLTHEQIAQTLSLSRSTVKNSMVASVKSIHQYLSTHHKGNAGSLLVIFMLS